MRHPSRRLLPTLGLALILAGLVASCSGPMVDTEAGELSVAAVGPEIIPLPDGFQPEGVTEGRGAQLFAGSLKDGSIVRADLRTGSVEGVVAPQLDRIAVGLDFDERSGLIWVAGGPGPSGGFVAATGDLSATFAFAAGPPSFVNDVVVTRDAAWFTDSFAPVLYRVPLDAQGRPSGAFVVVPLVGDWAQVPGFNANGIVATPDGGTLFVAHSALASIYAVAPESGVATRVDLGGASVAFADGLLLDGRTLYVVQNRLNQIAAVRLQPDLSRGELIGTITSAAFDVPTTVAEFGAHLYAVNARFGVATGPDVEYDVVRVDKVPASR